MTRFMLEQFLFEGSSQEYFGKNFRYDTQQQSIWVTFISFDEQDTRIAQFDAVTNVVEETYEDFDGHSEWAIVGLGARLINEHTWYITLQFLEKGFFFTSLWPHLLSTA